MLDHLGIQLDVMSHLLADLARRAGESEEYQTVKGMVDMFFQMHLQWPEDLLGTASNRADSEFYRSIVILTGDFLESEAPA